MKAVILAAGMGTRLQGLLKGLPKPLLEIDGKNLLDRSIESLLQARIDEIVVATGYKNDLVENEIKKYGSKKICCSKNDIFDETGSMHSLYSALGEPQDCLVLDGDIIYNPETIKNLVEHKQRDCVVLSPCRNVGDEVYVVMDAECRISYLGKKKPDSGELLEFTGISRFSNEYMKQMFAIHKAEFLNGHATDYYEDCAFKASKIMPWYGFADKSLVWSEIDNLEHHKYVLENILPRLKKL